MDVIYDLEKRVKIVIHTVLALLIVVVKVPSQQFQIVDTYN